MNGRGHLNMFTDFRPPIHAWAWHRVRHYQPNSHSLSFCVPLSTQLPFPLFLCAIINPTPVPSLSVCHYQPNSRSLYLCASLSTQLPFSLFLCAVINITSCLDCIQCTANVSSYTAPYFRQQRFKERKT
eukprot:TRINITY_DN51977_c0_g1_i5.p1 TRINITY_DN51977_c0_g1~~TRINITY_DN51977_c0_g1_i5.p1  ORF type:complete len:129 (+),score=1.48 TRINITY_DN51977_c0_g1_i5:50-436(+)